MSIKAGDVVQLKSGGNYMTVEKIRERGAAVCVWFVDGDIKSYDFQPEALLVVVEQE